jgi:hypothetical protein
VSTRQAHHRVHIHQFICEAHFSCQDVVLLKSPVSHGSGNEAPPKLPNFSVDSVRAEVFLFSGT